jgi:alpha-beta hydrolase superfamily lysophospholipase
MKNIGKCLVLITAMLVSGLIIAIACFDPKEPPPMDALSSPFLRADFSRIPPLKHYRARDGSDLAFREYSGSHPRKAIVMVHGSSGASGGLHPLAERLQRAGFTVYCLDIRGHGASGRRGDISYVGQLEDDIEDFLRSALANAPAPTLVGFSAGGGFVLRFAGSARQGLFSRYVLLAPYLRHDAPPVKAGNGQWAVASAPRIVGLALLGKPGEAMLGHLPVIRYAVPAGSAAHQTATYSFRLWRNFKPHDDYAADLRNARQRVDVIVAEKDALFDAGGFISIFNILRPGTLVKVVPAVGHIELTTSESGAATLARVLDA